MYITLADFKAYAGIAAEDAADDALLEQQLIPAVQSWIEAHCNRRFEATEDTTRRFDAERDVEGDTLTLDADLAAITSITNGDGVVLAGSAYTTEPRGGAPVYAIRLKRSSDAVWTWEDTPEDAITITGRWAYSVTPPAIIQQACRRLVHFIYMQKDTATPGSGDAGVARTSPDGVVIFPTSMPKDVIAMLAPFRRL